MSKKKTIIIFGFKLSTDNFAAAIICVIITICLSIWLFYRKDKLDNGNNIIVNAKIIEVYKRPSTKGRQISLEPELKCKYYLQGIEYTKTFGFSEKLWKTNSIRIGDCIEIKINTENKQIYEWNKKKETLRRCGQK